MSNKFNEEILEKLDEEITMDCDGNPLYTRKDLVAFLLSTINKVREDERKLLAEKVENKIKYKIRLPSDLGGDIIERDNYFFNLALDTVLQVLKDK